MKTEYEATFENIEKDDARERLARAGAALVRPEFLQKRIVLDLPKGHEKKGSFVRVRDEGDKITLTLKAIGGGGISDQKETEITVGDFDAAGEFLKAIGCIALSYEESRRELWKLDGADVTIDEWPFLGTVVEVEGDSEAQVKSVSEKLGFDWNSAKFCAIGMLYVEKYGFGPMDIAKRTGKMSMMMFAGENPFV